MNEEPQVWHYGLVAQIWAAYDNDPPELPYYQEKIKQFGEPVLDLACGTGRLLIPLLNADLDVDGCDISADMLAHCKQKAEQEGLPIRLFEQPMHQLDLSRRYKTIYICGSFGLAGSRRFDQQTLDRCCQHLLPGGALLFNIDAEYADREGWQMWLKEERAALPQPWPDKVTRQRSAGDYELIYRSRVLAIDPLEQSYEREIHVEKWQEGKLAAEEKRSLRGNMYFKNEVVTMLQLAGFKDIRVTGDYSDHPATADSAELNFIAHK